MLLQFPSLLGTELERTQAAHMQQMQQQLAQLEAQLRAAQAPAPQRQSSHSPSGTWRWVVKHVKANGMTMAGRIGETVGLSVIGYASEPRRLPHSHLLRGSVLDYVFR